MGRDDAPPGPAFPWAGVIWLAGEQPMQPVDFSGLEVIRFRTQGDGGGGSTR